MKKRRKLSLRIAAYLLAAQLSAYFVGWLVAISLGLYGTDDFATSFDEMTYARMRSMLIESIRRENDQDLAIEPSPALRSEFLKTPSLRIAAFNPEDWRALPGSSPDLVSALGDTLKVSPTWLSFSLENRKNKRPGGFLQQVNTAFGPIAIAVYGARFQLTDVLLNFIYDFRWLGVYLIPTALMSVGIAWFAIRRGLAPLRALANDAARIHMSSLNQRLPDHNVPDEVGPLVDSINNALTRLDEGSARLKRFIANAAHELRTPVAILTARLEAPRTASFFSDLQRDARRIRNIVEQLLATIQISDKEELTAQRIDLIEVARAIAADALLLAIQNRRQIEFEGPDIPVIVKGSRFAIQSILSNLIDNALRAEPESGKILVRVNADATIEVVDHGAGVAFCDHEKLFEPFWRKSPEGGGVGLGLAIASELMAKLGGKISVIETPGGGATFKLKFPRTGSS